MKTKRRLLIIIAFLLLSNCKKSSTDSSKYLVFRHTGMELKHIKPLYISTVKLNIPLTNSELENFKNIYGNGVSEKDKQQYSRLQSKIIITDKKTLSELIIFIINHKEFYTNKINLNHGDGEEFQITLNNKSYDVFYKLAGDFLSKLTIYLRVNNCDKNVINALNEL